MTMRAYGLARDDILFVFFKKRWGEADFLDNYLAGNPGPVTYEKSLLGKTECDGFIRFTAVLCRRTRCRIKS